MVVGCCDGNGLHDDGPWVGLQDRDATEPHSVSRLDLPLIGDAGREGAEPAFDIRRCGGLPADDAI